MSSIQRKWVFLTLLVGLILVLASCKNFLYDMAKRTPVTTSLSAAGHYTVDFYRNEGGEAEKPCQTVEVIAPEVAVAEMPADPERYGYAFTGWNTEKDGGGSIFNQYSYVNANIAVYAQWKLAPDDERTRWVSFDKNGGDREALPRKLAVVEPETTVDKLPGEPVRTGYLFNGWNTQADGAGAAFTAATVVSETMTVYAQWGTVPDGSFIVTFGENGGDTPANPLHIIIAPPARTVAETSSQMPQEPKRNGYIFAGWNRNADGSGEPFSRSTLVNSDITVWAQWEAVGLDTLYVYFDENGADIPASPRVLAAVPPENTVSRLPDEPVREGSLFGGWNTKANGTGSVFTADTVVSETITVYAQWWERRAGEYAVTFHRNGGETDADPRQEIVVSGGTVGSLPQPPTRTGYTFKNWNTEPDGTGQTFTVSTPVTANITVYAQWQALQAGEYMVTFHRNGGETDADPRQKIVVSGGNVDSLPQPPTRPGYTFKNWNTEPDGTGQTFTVSTPVTASITVYAQWQELQPDEYVVTFHRNGGETEADPRQKAVVSGGNVGSLPQAPTRTGYTFKEWNIEPDGMGQPFTASTPVTANITVYAQWQVVEEPVVPKTYTIVIDAVNNAAGDSVLASPSSGKTGDAITLIYTVANTYHNNLLNFAGIANPIAVVPAAGAGMRVYVVNAADASDDDEITIIATFTHTDLTVDPIMFVEAPSHINKTYGDAPFVNAVCPGHLGGGVVTYTSHNTAVATVDSSGEVTILKAGTAVISAVKAADAVYAADTASYTLTVSRKSVSITGVLAESKEYNGQVTAAFDASNAVINGIINDDDVIIVNGSARFGNKHAGDGKPVTFSGWSLTGADAGNYTLTGQPANGTANISAKPVIIYGLTAQDKEYDGTTVATLNLNAATIFGTIAGDDVQLSGNALFTNKNAGAGRQVVLDGFSFAGSDAGNYTLAAQPSLTANINQKPVTITITVGNKTYDNSTAVNITNTTITGNLDGGNLTASGTAAFADKNAGTGKTITFSGWQLYGTARDNYTLTNLPADTTADINKRPVNIIGLTAQGKVYDGTPAVTINGVAAVDDPAGGESVPIIPGTASFADKNVGTNKPITLNGWALSGAAAGNYTATFPSLTANITAKPATITGLTANDKVYDAGTSAEVSGAPVIPEKISGDTLNVTTGSATFASKDVGSRLVSFSGFVLTGADAANYSLTQPGSVNANISPKSVTLTIPVATSKTYDGTVGGIAVTGTPTITGNLDGANLSATNGTATFSSASAGSRTITFSNWQLSGSAAGNYTLSGQPANVAGTITPKTLTLSVSGSRTTLTPLSGETITTLTFTPSGFVTGDSPSTSYSCSPPSGLTFATAASTLTYNGTNAFATPSQTLTFTANAGSNYTAPTASLSISVYDGQNSGTSPDRRIPINGGNLTAFNDYANTLNGLTRHYKLTGNVEFPSNWMLIGNSTVPNSFTGSFNGQNYTIASTRGIFGYIGGDGIVQNVGVIGGNVSNFCNDSNGTSTFVGGIVGNNQGTIQNCYVAGGNVNGAYNFATSYTGGIAGLTSLYGKIQNCYVTSHVSGGGGGETVYVGGIVGTTTPTSSSVQNCYVTGNVSVSVSVNTGITVYVGGIVGNIDMMSSVSKCYVTGQVNGGNGVSPGSGGSMYVGGIAGSVGRSTSGYISNCVALNPLISSTQDTLGRIVDNLVYSNLSSNYGAVTTMRIRYKQVPSTSSVTYVPTSNVTGKDGATTNTYNTQSFWQSTVGFAFGTADAWEWSTSAQRPILRNMPAGNAQ